jgi:hypothetical protein
VRHYDGYVAPGTHPMGRDHFWLVARPIEETEEGSVGSRAGLRVDNTPAAASDYLFGVRATEPIAPASVALVLLAAILASLIPLRRASSVEPASVAR